LFIFYQYFVQISNEGRMSRKRKGCLWGIVVLVALAAFPLVWRAAVTTYYRTHIYTPTTAPGQPAAIVFGAAVYGNRLSSVLRDRMDTAIRLYEIGAVQQIVVSGDNRSPDYNEPGAMMAYAVARGVPANAVLPDYAGHRTYDTCYRARHVFGVETAVLVTQAFHLPRALFTCRGVGVAGVGVAADLRSYRAARWYEVRETGATLVALWDVLRQVPPPTPADPVSLLAD
jgi:SanA protein